MRYYSFSGLISIRLFAALVFTGLLISGGAAPFSKLIRFTQPGGQEIQLHGQGDEFYAVFETLDGYTVLYDQFKKGYCYARLSADASSLESTGALVSEVAPQALGLAQHLRMPESAIKQQVAQRRAIWDAGMEVSKRWSLRKASLASDSSGGASFAPPRNPTVGLKVGLTLLIDFDDDPATITQAEIADFCNGDNYTAYGNNGSVKAYFAYNSNGKLTYTNIVTIYVRAPKPKSYYNDTSKDAGMQGRLLINDALDVLKALPNYTTEILPLFDALTVDSQKRAVAFNVFYAGGNGNVWSRGLWPHSWNLASAVELSPGGKKVYWYQLTNIGSQLEIGTFCHENGHMLCDYPDLYDYTYMSNGVGWWCLMCLGSWGGNDGTNPSQICAYLKRASGWATTTDVDANSSLLATVGSDPGTNFNRFYRYQKPGVNTEYFLAECRTKAGHDGALPGSGVLVWHIDELGDNSTVSLTPNTWHDNYEATLVQADNRWHMEKGSNDGDANDPYYQGNTASGYKNLLSDTSSPNAHWWDGTASGMVLRDFSAKAASMTFVIGTNNPTLPTIVTHPTNQIVLSGATVYFTVAATGPAPLSYQWMKDNSRVAGATSATLTLPNVPASASGVYTAVVTNDFGSATSQPATLTVIATVPLRMALNNSNLDWTTDALIPWYGQADVNHDGTAAGRSYFIGDDQQTRVSTVITGPGTLTFWWKVSSETNGDILTFTSTGPDVTNSLAISGEVDWTPQTFYLPAGVQTLEWAYTKNGTLSSGRDAGFVDQVTFLPGYTLPSIIRPPVGLNTMAGVPVTFSVTAGGTPKLSYQWMFNSAPIAGATANSYTIFSPSAADNGYYSVRVSNAYGETNSAPVLLGIVPLVVGGDNALGQLEVSMLATNAVGVGAGAWHTLVLRADGTLLAWGQNFYGQCSPPAGLRKIVRIAAGAYHSLALTLDGRIAAWGANTHGQANPPAGLSNVVAIAAGFRHNLALRADGTVAGWGDNSSGQLNVPAGLNHVVAVAAGGNHSLALRNDGTVFAWGENIDSMGGYGGQSVVPWDMKRVVAIGAGDYHSLAVQADGTVRAWGDNWQGQCLPPAGLANAVSVAGGSTHSLALRADGTVLGWGNNWNGLCTFPATLTNVTQMAVGNSHNVLLVGTPASAPTLLRPARQEGQFTVLLQTFPGITYLLEYQTTVGGPWNPAGSLWGDGGLSFLVDNAAAGPCRFYRVRWW